MSSWVRYCVAVYVGLLISGALVRPPWGQHRPAEPMPSPAFHDATGPEHHLPPAIQDGSEQRDIAYHRGASDTL